MLVICDEHVLRAPRKTSRGSPLGSGCADIFTGHACSITSGPLAEDVERLSVRRRRSSSGKSAASPLQFSEPAMSYLRRLAQAAARDAARSPEEEATHEEVEVMWLSYRRSSRLHAIVPLKAEPALVETFLHSMKAPRPTR